MLAEDLSQFGQTAVRTKGRRLVQDHIAQITEEQFERRGGRHQHTGVEPHVREHVGAHLGCLLMAPDQTLQCGQGFPHDPIKRVFHLGFLLDIDDILVGQRPCQKLVQSLGLLPLVQIAGDRAYRHTVSRSHSRTFPVIALHQPFIHQPFQTLDRFTISLRHSIVLGVEALHLGDRGCMDHLVSQSFRRRIGQVNDPIFNVDFPVETIDISFITVGIIVLFPTIHAFRGAKYHLIITVR